MKRFMIILSVLLFAMFCGMGGYLLGTHSLPKSTIEEGEYAELETSIKEVESYINTYFYKDVDNEDLQTGVLKGMAAMLGDPYSGYFTEEEFARYQEGSSGTYAGIGILLGYDVDEITMVVKDVYEGGSALESGMKIGDIIVEADGQQVNRDMELVDVSTLLKGKVGTKVDVKVSRDGKLLDFNLERRQITFTYVESKMMDDSIGYIKLREFSGSCAQEFEDALKELKGKGAKGLIIDLRGNPGRYVHDAVNIADMLLPKGLIVYTEDKYGNKQEYESDANSVDLPMVMLIDGDSASASEILAGAMQDHKAADLVGVKSFGKGIVQKPFPVTSTGGALMLTTMTYFTPNGRNIHHEGIEPEYVVELPLELLNNPEDLTEENDTQLQKGLEVIKEKTNKEETPAA